MTEGFEFYLSYKIIVSVADQLDGHISVVLLAFYIEWFGLELMNYKVDIADM